MSTQNQLHLLGISGSLRKASVNTGLLRAAQTLLPPGVTMEIADLSHIPLYNEDVERAGMPRPVEEFRAHIAAADALLIATPEYNHSFPGVLKNALDWASRSPNAPTWGKPTGILGAAGMSGSSRAQYHLRQVGTTLNLLMLNKPEMLVPFASQKFDSDGNLIDEATREQLGKFLQALLAWTHRLRQEIN